MLLFDAIIVSRDYHVYKELSWSNAKVGNEVKVGIETNARADPGLILGCCKI